LTRSVFGAFVESITTTSPKPRAISWVPPEDECPQQDLAELRVGLRKGEPLFAIELDDLT
jgi:hypothetical protein